MACIALNVQQPGLTLRLRARRKRRSLDRALAAGERPADSPELALRARELAQAETRQCIASSLLNIIDSAEEPSITWRVQGIDPPVRAGAVLEARNQLIALAEALRAGNGGSPRGVALAACLVWDPESPVYRPPRGADVTARARDARAALNATG